jgi:hypothetical protein
VAPERAQVARRQGAPVRPAVQREVVPTIGVDAPGRCREVRGVGEDPIEPSRPQRHVGVNGHEPQPLGPRGRGEVPERRAVEIGGDDGRPRPRRPQREVPVAGADLEDAFARPRRREPGQQLGVLADRIDGGGIARVGHVLV